MIRYEIKLEDTRAEGTWTKGSEDLAQLGPSATGHELVQFVAVVKTDLVVIKEQERIKTQPHRISNGQVRLIHAGSGRRSSSIQHRIRRFWTFNSCLMSRMAQSWAQWLRLTSRPGYMNGASLNRSPEGNQEIAPKTWCMRTFSSSGCKGSIPHGNFTLELLVPLEE